MQVSTKALTSGFLNAFGDVLAQFAFNEEGQAFDWKRLGIFTFLVRFCHMSVHAYINTYDDQTHIVSYYRVLHLSDHPCMYGMD
jgi:hypothetical protein